MRRLVLPALALSFGLNLYLLHTRREEDDTRPTAAEPAALPNNTTSREPIPNATKAEPVGEDALSRARAEAAEIEKRIVELRKLTAPLRELSPADRAILASDSLHDKLKAIAGLTAEAQRSALNEMRLRSDPAGDEIWELLRNESDPAILAVLTQLIEARGLGRKLGPGEIPELLDLLLRGEPAARRRAAAVAFRRNPGSREISPELVDACCAGIRSDPDPAVVAELARLVRAAPATATPSVIAALDQASIRLPEGSERRRVLDQFARLTAAEDGGLAMFDRWDLAGSRAARDELAAALGQVIELPPPPADDVEEEARRLAERRRRFATVYQGSDNYNIRRRLVLAAATGLGLLARDAPTDARFLRELATADPDADTRTRLEELADRVQGGEVLDSARLLKVLFEKR